MISFKSYFEIVKRKKKVYVKWISILVYVYKWSWWSCFLIKFDCVQFSTGLKCVCSGACCPSGVRLYRMDGNSLRVHWRSSGSSHNYVTELLGSSNNYTCTASPGQNSCDIAGVQCGDVYNVVVAPLTPEGSKVPFCAHRLYSGRRRVRRIDILLEPRRKCYK